MEDQFQKIFEEIKAGRPPFTGASILSFAEANSSS